jgi:hypothetical protein
MQVLAFSANKKLCKRKKTVDSYSPPGVSCGGNKETEMNKHSVNRTYSRGARLAKNLAGLAQEIVQMHNSFSLGTNNLLLTGVDSGSEHINQ